MNLNLADANIYGLIVKLGTGVTNKNLMSIPWLMLIWAEKIAMTMVYPTLLNVRLVVILTRRILMVTVMMTREWLCGYNPLGEGMLPINPQYVNTVKGKILLQIEGDKSALYVAGDGKRYYLGNPGDAYAVMRQMNTGPRIGQAMRRRY